MTETYSSSATQSDTHGTSHTNTRGRNEGVHKRPLVTPDEVGRYFGNREEGLALALISGHQPLVVRRSPYFSDAAFAGLFDPHKDHDNPPTLRERQVIAAREAAELARRREREEIQRRRLAEERARAASERQARSERDSQRLAELAWQEEQERLAAERQSAMAAARRRLFNRVAGSLLSCVTMVTGFVGSVFLGAKVDGGLGSVLLAATLFLTYVTLRGAWSSLKRQS